MREELPDALAGERIDRVVAFLTGVNRTTAAAAVDAGRVTVNGTVVTARSRKVATGDVVEVPEDLAPPAVTVTAVTGDASVDVPVVFADEHIVVVDKPAGLVVHPGAGNDTGTLVQGIVALFPEVAGVGDPARPGIVHRLDKGTSGLMVVARSQLAYDSLVEQLAARRVERTYMTLVWGSVEAPSGLIDAPIGRAASDRTRMAVAADGREARTRYEVRERLPHTTLLECRLETGRTHQIRVHLAAIDHPVVGDSRYGGSRKGLRFGRPWLHASALALDHPVLQGNCRFSSELPQDLVDLLMRMREQSGHDAGTHQDPADGR